MKLFRVRTGIVMTDIFRTDIFMADHGDGACEKQNPGSGAMTNQASIRK